MDNPANAIILYIPALTGEEPITCGNSGELVSFSFSLPWPTWNETTGQQQKESQ
jgi:hypothetical protein